MLTTFILRLLSLPTQEIESIIPPGPFGIFNYELKVLHFRLGAWWEVFVLTWQLWEFLNMGIHQTPGNQRNRVDGLSRSSFIQETISISSRTQNRVHSP